MFQLHYGVCPFVVKIRYVLEVMNKRLIQYNFELVERWNYDPYHDISEMRKYFSSPTYENDSKPDLEKIANQAEFLVEIDVFQEHTYEKEPELDSLRIENITELTIESQSNLIDYGNTFEVVKKDKRRVEEEKEVETLPTKKIKLMDTRSLLIQTYLVQIDENDDETNQVIKE